MQKKRNSFKASEARLGYLLIAPAFLLVAAVIFYPVLYNVWLSFNKVSLNPRRPDLFIGLENYQTLLQDAAFWHSIWITLLYTVITVLGATLAGLGAALLLNRPLKGRRYYRSILLLPYVAPVISLVFVWQYMFNPVYGMVNYSLVDKLGVFQERIDWLDSPGASFWLVILFDIWHIFPFAFMMILAKLQTVDASLQEAAEIDGANGWKKFWYVTLPELSFVIGSLMILRFIWNFYKFDEVYLLTKEVPVVGVYTYETAFSTYNHGLAAAITVSLFALVMVFVLIAVRKVLKW
ncbi:carbohydrate ABC transporter permease [Tumebacillus permanentifrigoris]|uniref:Carbohydrate ABC transporter membrane protein 1 (CUT1 family) n=1 Tax=Tumebacillus permanentifrigoris TaxID=378543 RepID=A0A316DEW0_9BACL|nr:sugar ABC transporter permease [Tumebacillus permanentifrigoris]PWK16574.1 carbohydrate ABC transporter membrane protein 1 (CUT1 family) [Tumebacillus permanentifrigoris]